MSDTRHSEEQDDTSSFKVTDRRQFTNEGEVRQESEAESEPSEAPPPRAEAPPPQAREETPPETAEQETQEGMNFASFLLSPRR